MRYFIKPAFKPGTDKLEWVLVDALNDVIVAHIYTFDGTAQAIVDMLNQKAKEAAA